MRAGRRDSAPSDAYLRKVLAGFDWDARSRMVDGTGRALGGAVLVSTRSTPSGAVATVEASAPEDDLRQDLTHWGVGLARAGGAIAAQVWRGRGHTGGLVRLGMELVRPWWRMDRDLATEPLVPVPVPGYELRDAGVVAAATWADVHNLTFADHWGFSPRSEEDLMPGRPPDLSLLAVTPDGLPAALTLSQIEVYTGDSRPQPVGVISSVGTLQAHRRRGLATWLVAESLVRLHRGGAREASLYVDGESPMRAFDAYTKLGFELAFETEVWEATFR